MTLPYVISRHRDAVIGAIAELVARRSEPVCDAVKYHFGFLDDKLKPTASAAPDKTRPNIGKLIRAALSLLACEAANGQISRVLPFSAVIELIHNASLIHDDLEDMDAFRRHRTTVWKLFGNAQSIVSGNFTIKVAHVAIKYLLELGIDDRAFGKLQIAMTEAHLRMVEGQCLDIAAESADALNLDQYIEMIDRKTGHLTAFALYAGALIGPPTRPDYDLCDKLFELGLTWGRLFQIQDDIIGVWGDERSGKPVGADIKRNKKNLPFIHLLQHAEPKIAAETRAIAKLPELDDADVERVLNLMRRAETREWCRRKSGQYYHAAQRQIEDLRLTPDLRRQFNQLGDYLHTRMA